MQLPYTPLTDRSMYSAAVYGKLFGFAPGLPLPPLALNTLASSITTSGSGFSTGNSVYVNDDPTTVGAEAQQNGGGGGYQCGVYGPRYHPYLAYSASSSKRLDSAILH